MRAILLTHAAGPVALRQDLELWKQHHGKAPDFIVGEKDLAYGLVNEPEFAPEQEPHDASGLARWSGIPVLELVDLWEAEAEALGEREPNPGVDEGDTD